MATDAGGGSGRSPKPKVSRGRKVGKQKAAPARPRSRGRAKPTTQQASMVGLDAYRGFANSMEHLRKNPTGGGLGVANPFNGVNLNPFDYLNRGLGAAGDVFRSITAPNIQRTGTTLQNLDELTRRRR